MGAGMNAATALMPIPGPADPIVAPRKQPVRADGKTSLVGLPTWRRWPIFPKTLAR